MPLRNCDAAHCGGADAEINEVCIAEGWAVGHPVITRDSSGICQCHCSCLALGTPVAASLGINKPIESFRVGDSVVAAGSDLQWNTVPVRFSSGSSTGVQPGVIFVEYVGGQLIVTPDHLFLLPGGKLKRAERLSPTDKLVGANGNPVDIERVSVGTYVGGFHHIATSTEDPQNDLTNHLLITNGIVSADYTLQLFYRDADPHDTSNFLEESNKTAPIVGTEEYYATAPFRAAERSPSLGQSFEALRISSFVDTSAGYRHFVPMEHTKVNIPPNADSFISKEEADRIAARASFRSLVDPDSRSWAEYLTRHHRAFYPDVVYHVNWESNEVNAYAWVDGGVRHVSLEGGLIRNEDLEVEGLALILAHELSHHYGGDPSHDGGLSCEGQSDYYGVKNVMRRAWFGEDYFIKATRGTTQMAAFFNTAEPGSNTGGGGCTHPPGACRIFTYNAAINLSPRPSCAG
jgi:hypothetical protein